MSHKIKEKSLLQIISQSAKEIGPKKLFSACMIFLLFLLIGIAVINLVRGASAFSPPRSDNASGVLAAKDGFYSWNAESWLSKIIEDIRKKIPKKITPTPTSVSVATPTVIPVTNAPSQGVLRADFNNSGSVDIFDLSFLLSHWNSNNQEADLNGNGLVDVFDISILLSSWR